SWPRDWSSDVCSSDLGQRVEETDHVRRGVAAGGQDLCPADVRLRFQVAAELEEQRVEPDTADGVQDLRGVVADLPAEEAAEDLRSEERRVGKGGRSAR